MQLTDSHTHLDLAKILIFVVYSLNCMGKQSQKENLDHADCWEGNSAQRADRPPKRVGNLRSICYISLVDQQTTSFPKNGQQLPHQRHISIQPIIIPHFSKLANHTLSQRDAPDREAVRRYISSKKTVELSMSTNHSTISFSLSFRFRFFFVSSQTFCHFVI